MSKAASSSGRSVRQSPPGMPDGQALVWTRDQTSWGVHQYRAGAASLPLPAHGREHPPRAVSSPSTIAGAGREVGSPVQTRSLKDNLHLVPQRYLVQGCPGTGDAPSPTRGQHHLHPLTLSLSFASSSAPTHPWVCPGTLLAAHSGAAQAQGALRGMLPRRQQVSSSGQGVVIPSALRCSSQQ